MALKQSCCQRPRRQKRKTPKTAEKTGMPQKTGEVFHVNPKPWLVSDCPLKRTVFFVVRSETERVGLRSKLSRCPKMMVGMMVES